MNRLIAFIEGVRSLQKMSNSCADTVVNVILSANGGDVKVLIAMRDLLQLAAEAGIEAGLQLLVDGDVADAEHLEELVGEGYPPEQWRVIVNKTHVLKTYRPQEFDAGVLFFLDEEAFTSWANSIRALRDQGDVFIAGRALVVMAPGVDTAFGGPELAVLPLDDSSLPDAWSKETAVPSETRIREYVHLVPSEPLRLVPRRFLLTWGDRQGMAAEPFRRAAGVAMGACLVDVLYGAGKVVLKGVRHIETTLLAPSDKAPTPTTLDLLQKALEWVYEERVETRKKLLTDRLSLDLAPGESLLSSLGKHLEGALQQSRDQYRFVILDRKDEYSRELRDLLKDLQKQSELYAEKMRALVSGLLRDALAAFLLVGLTLSVRLGRDVEVLTSDWGRLFFKALACYFIVAALLQGGLAARDASLSRKELKNWSKVTRDYITPDELKDHIDDSLGGRRRTFWWFLGLVISMYLGLALASWNLESLVTFANTASEAK